MTNRPPPPSPTVYSSTSLSALPLSSPTGPSATPHRAPLLAPMPPLSVASSSASTASSSPRTVANFKSMCTGSSGSSYKGTLVHKILQGQYLVAGRQGPREKGEVKPPLELARNTETIVANSFSLKHSRPGTLSLCLSENDDEDGIKMDPNYRNVEFLITTGPGPCPQLDNQNIVFGEVLEGLDVVTAIAAIPTYKPAERIRLFNDFAEFLGDERAQNARVIWNWPLKTVYIGACGELQVAKPSLSPSLP